MDAANHREREWSLAGEHFGYACSAADEWFEFLAGPGEVFDASKDCVDGIRGKNGKRASFVRVDESGEGVELALFL
jgi:hypothetical protein